MATGAIKAKKAKKPKQGQAPKPPSPLEAKFWREWPKTGLFLPVAEYRFHPVRQWRLDFAWPDKKLGIELEGGTWSGGRHTTGAGYAGDCEKYNAAVELGWRVLRYTKVDDEMILQIMRVYEQA
jgi:very-short-patch-repair endonuclease